jgi:hypothetical protein
MINTEDVILLRLDHDWLALMAAFVPLAERRKWPEDKRVLERKAKAATDRHLPRDRRGHPRRRQRHLCPAYKRAD